MSDDSPTRETRRYHRVSPKFWRTSLPWSEDARTFAMFLLTSSHRTTEGLFYLPPAYAAADLGWPLERLAEPLAELIAEGFCDWCPDHCLVLINGAMEWQPPDNANQAKAAVKRLVEIPGSCHLTRDFKRLAERYAELLVERLPEGFGERVQEPQAQSRPLAQARRPAPDESETAEPDQPETDGGDIYEQAANITARREVDRRISQGDTIARPDGYVKGRRAAIVKDRMREWSAIVDADPTTTPEALADLVEPVKPPTPPHPTEATLAASLQRMAAYEPEEVDRAAPPANWRDMARPKHLASVPDGAPA
jgi:hypothetical protein